MPVHTLSGPMLRIAFERDGREFDAVVAPDGIQGLRIASLMLARLNEVQAGDRLTVTEMRAAP